MNKKDFYYDLPNELIAQTPLEERTSSKLMVLDKKTGEVSHKKFRDIINYLNKGDCLVLNNTKVLPARLFGYREITKSKIEVLLLKRIENNIWDVLVKPGKKAKIGNKIIFHEKLLKGEIIDITEDGNRIIKFEYEGIFEEVLDKLGEIPLPPYIIEKLEDKNLYQTVYAKVEGSAAAPTAGLHFTNSILEEIKNKGVVISYVTLHVGLGTFRPVKTDNILEHKMHSEYYCLEKSQQEKINNCKKNGGRIIAVGTTSCRVLETCGDENGFVASGFGETDIFIYPGYKFKIVDELITNFHLPESTLLMLISAMSTRENILNAYKIAIENQYRFFSFGDAMLIK